MTLKVNLEAQQIKLAEEQQRVQESHSKILS